MPSLHPLHPTCRLYSHWPSTSKAMVGPATLPDPLESRMVRVGASGVEGGGEGLFAARDLPANTIVSIYNGIRMGPKEVAPWEGRDYAIVVEWEERVLAFPFPWVSEEEHMDMPAAFHSTTNYTATLAHKVNHSFVPNCRWSNMEHPCYGLVPAILTLQEVAEGEELTVHYELNMEVGGEGAPAPAPRTPRSGTKRPGGSPRHAAPLDQDRDTPAVQTFISRNFGGYGG